MRRNPQQRPRISRQIRVALSWAGPMWPRVFQVGSWIAAALAALVLFFALYVFVAAWMLASQGSPNSAGRGYREALLVLGLALLLSSPPAILPSGRRVA